MSVGRQETQRIARSRRAAGMLVDMSKGIKEIASHLDGQVKQAGHLSFRFYFHR